MKNNDKLTKLLNQRIEMSDLLGESQQPGKTCSNINSDSAIKVAHLCMQDFGGAGKAAYRLHKGLRAIGVDSTMLVLNKRSGDPSVKVLPNDYSMGMANCLDVSAYNSPVWNQQAGRWHKLMSEYSNRPAGLEMFTDAVSDVRLDRVREIQEADIINLHWVAGAMDYHSAPLAIGGKPIVWTLHDMNSFAGGCHYAGDCRKYIEGCGACPQLGSDTENDLSHQVWKQKYDAYKTLNINVVTPSRWLGKCASDSKLFSRFPVTVIPNGFPINIFKPYPKAEIRKALNIPESANVILFGADSVVNERKGFKYLLEALNRLSLKSRHDNIILTFGRLPQGVKITSRYPILNLGSIADENQLAKVYSAADVFVIPSLEDNLPNTVIEAMACGVPVVGFDIGGIPDMVEHKKTGYLVKPKDIAGLIEGIEWVISSYDSGTHFSKRCREKVEKEYALDVQARAYNELYNRILQDHLSWVEDIQAKVNILNEQGEELFKKGDLEGALNAFTKAIEIDPNFATAHNNLGVLYWHAGEVQKAVEHFVKALEIDPNDRDTIFNCGQIFKSLERIEDATAIYSSYLKRNPNDEKIAKALADLQDKRIVEAKDEKYLVSAIVSTYNSERFIRGCLEDLEAQTIADQLEIIVVDSGSQENEEAIVREYQQEHDNIVYIKTEQREGIYTAWNRGIKAARGKYITNANTDDRHRTDAFEVLSNTLDEHPDIALAYSDCHVSSIPNETYKENAKRRIYRFPEFSTVGAVLHYQFGPQAMWRKKIHEIIGYFDESYNAVGDYDFNLRFNLHLKAIHIAEPLGLYLEHPGAISFRDDTMAQEHRQIAVTYRNAEAIEKLYKQMGIACDTPEERARIHLDMGIRALEYYPPWKGGEPERNIELAAQCFRTVMELKPDWASGYNNFAIALCLKGRFQEAAELLERASRLMQDTTIKFTLNMISDALSSRRAWGDARLMPSGLSLPSQRDLAYKQKPSDSSAKSVLRLPQKGNNIRWGLKILFYFDRIGNSKTSSPAGTVMATMNFAQALLRDRPEVTIHLTGNLVGYPEKYESLQIIPLPHPSKRNEFLSGYDIVFFESHVMYFDGVAKPPGQTWVLHEHCWVADDPVVWDYMNDFDAVICVSKLHESSLRDQGIKLDKLIAIPNLIDSDLYSPRDVIRDDHSIMYAGGLTPHKCLHILFNAFRLVRQQIEDAELHIYGDGAMWRHGDNYGDHLKSIKPEGVYFHGYVDNKDMPQIYSKHSLLCLPSKLESFGLVTVEAQACGCIPVVHNVGGVSTTLVDGHTGFLYSPNTAEKLAEVIIKAITVVGASPSIRQRAVDFARGNFSTTRAAKYISNLWNRLTVAREVKRDRTLLESNDIESADVECERPTVVQSVPMRRPRIAVLCLPGLTSFLNDIVDFLRKSFEVKTCFSNNLEKIRGAIAWSDIVWLEWANELAIEVTNKIPYLEQKKVVCRIHRYEVFSGYLPKIEWGKVGKVIFVADCMRRIASELYPQLPIFPKSEVIYNNLNLDKFVYNPGAPGFNVAVVGYINQRKNPSAWMEILARLIKIDKRYVLHVAGELQDVTYKYYFENIINQLGLTKNVRFYGHVADIDKWLKDQHINYLLTTSVSESFGYSIAEAMATGIKPLIHWFPGAEEMWPESCLWSTVDQLIELIADNKYDSEQYRQFVADRYANEMQLKKIDRLLGELSPRVQRIKTEQNTDLTVLMRTYKRTQYFEQNVADGCWNGCGINLHIVDDGSDKHVVEKLKAVTQGLGATIDHYEPNKGVAHALGYGIKRIDSRYFVVVDDDDYVIGLEEFYETAKKIMESRSDILMIAVPFVYAADSVKQMKIQYDRRALNGKSGSYLLNLMATTGEIQLLGLGTLFCRADMGFQMPEGFFKNSEDYMLLARLCATFPERKIVVPSIGQYIRLVHNESISSSIKMTLDKLVRSLVAQTAGAYCLRKLNNSESVSLVEIMKSRGKILKRVYGQGQDAAYVIARLTQDRKFKIKTDEMRRTVSFLKESKEELPQEFLDSIHPSKLHLLGL